MSLAAELGTTLVDGAAASELCVSTAGLVEKPTIKASKDQLKEIWNRHLLGEKPKDIAEKMGLNYFQVQKHIYTTKKKAAAIKDVLTAVAPKKVDIIKIVTSDFKAVVFDPHHTSKKTLEKFWLDNIQFHGFSVKDLAGNLGISESAAQATLDLWLKQAGKTVAKAPAVPLVPKVFSTIKDPLATVGEWPIGDDVIRKTGANTPDRVNTLYRGWHHRLTPDQLQALERYTGSTYRDINAVLRKASQTNRPTITKYIDDITTALTKAPHPPPPELVWRGMGNAGADEFVTKLASGDVFEMSGFQSTSIRPETASGWGSKVLLEIKPKVGAYVRPLSSHKGEYEFLLPHNAKYRVRGQRTIKLGDGTSRTVIQLEML